MDGKYLVDTNVIIRLLCADERSMELFNQIDCICIPSIVAGELYYGAQNSTRKRENLEIFANFISQYKVIDTDLPTAQVYGEIKAQLKKDGITIPENDLWIAATAKAYQYTLISYDNHFRSIKGLSVIS